jgi:type II secretory pathway component PulJ
MTNFDLASPRSHRRSGGFTLIEILAASMLTAIVMGVAVSFQVSLGRATAAARETLRYKRHAVTLLDRIGRDLAGAYFIARPDNLDPLNHPWIFVASDLSGDGSFTNKSNAVKFVTRNYQPQGLEEHASDIAVMSYFLDKVEGEPGYQLLRWRKARMPQLYDPEYPSPDDPLCEVVGENIRSFQMSFIDMTGGEAMSWDSAEREGFDSIPLAVKIEIAMLDPNAETLEDDLEFDSEDYEDLDSDIEPFSGEREEGVFSKTVILPVRPLDWLILEQETYKAADDAGQIEDDGYGDIFDGGEDGEDGDGDGDDPDNEDGAGAPTEMDGDSS